MATEIGAARMVAVVIIVKMPGIPVWGGLLHGWPNDISPPELAGIVQIHPPVVNGCHHCRKKALGVYKFFAGNEDFKPKP